MDLNIFIMLIKIIIVTAGSFVIIALVFINIFPMLFYKPPIVKSEQKNFDVIIVLGYPAASDGKPSPIMRERVIKAVKLFNEGAAEQIICSGGAAHNKFVEADIMLDFAKNLGVPENRLIKEEKSSNTYGNIKNSVEIMKNNHWSSAVVVTSPWHLKRSSYLLSKFNITYLMSKSDYPKEFSCVFIAAIYMFENFIMTKNKILFH